MKMQILPSYSPIWEDALSYFAAEFAPTRNLTSDRLGYFWCASFLDALQLTERLEEVSGNLSFFQFLNMCRVLT